MTPEAFCYWLQGFMELSEADELGQRQVKMIRKHLDTVFVNVTAPPDRDPLPPEILDAKAMAEIERQSREIREHLKEQGKRIGELDRRTAGSVKIC